MDSEIDSFSSQNTIKTPKHQTWKYLLINVIPSNRKLLKTKPRSGKQTWLKNSCSKQSIHGSDTSIGLASLEMSATLMQIIMNWESRKAGGEKQENADVLKFTLFIHI